MCLKTSKSRLKFYAMYMNVLHHNGSCLLLHSLVLAFFSQFHISQGQNDMTNTKNGVYPCS